MTPTITLSFAAAAALINIWLAARVSLVRVKRERVMGDGGDPVLLARMRAHANFVEYTPFALILSGLIEWTTGPSTWLWAAVAVFLVARLSHAFGMDRPAPNPFRMVGILTTLVVLLGLAAWAATLAWQSAHGIGTGPILEAVPLRS